MIQFVITAIASGLVAGGILTIIGVAFDRRVAGDRVVPAGSPPPKENWLTSSWPVALVLLGGFVATYRIALDRWPGSPFGPDKLPCDERIFWGVLIFAAVAAFDSLPRTPAIVRLSLLLAACYFAVSYVVGGLIGDYTGVRGALLTAGLMAWLIVMRAGLDISTRHGSWKPFDAVVVAISIGFMGVALAGTGGMKFGQLAWGLGGAAGAVALGVLFRRALPTAPAYATVLALSLGTLLMLGIFGGSTNPLPWFAAVLVSLAPAGRFLARVGPLGKLTGWPTLVLRALLVLAPAALAAGLAIMLTTDLNDMNQ